MHLLVTDRLSCPRCGPAFGLILLADELRERRVLEGALGCANCRERYPVEGGFGDLRPPPRSPLPAGPVPSVSEGRGNGPRDPAEDTFRLAALLGVREGPGLLLLAGGWVALAGRLAAMIHEIEVVALDPHLRASAEEAGVSRLTTGRTLPFFHASLRGVALDGAQLVEWEEEAIRVLGPGARLVVRDPPADLPGRLEARGLQPLLQTGRYVVAQRG
ncbi:MAG: hypothetical protein EA422_13200 [Gemmatimonadales bacterium]|nr:MAG: hypothetical protein EA422_13200 [Gemmatimonadales bacterium]